jgi:predicted HicB family RNase H-like nuclease
MGQITLTGVPGPVTRKLSADAKRQDKSVNELVIEILGGKTDGTRGKFRGPLTGDRLPLRLPDQLHRDLSVLAARERGTVRGVILSIVANHYKLKPIAITRRPKRG